MERTISGSSRFDLIPWNHYTVSVAGTKSGRGIMTDQRELTRRQARLRRSLFKSAAERKAKDNRQLARKMLDRVQAVLSNNDFNARLSEHGVQTIPARLSKMLVGDDIDCSLDFIVAWNFFYPLLQQPAISQHLESDWPGFVSQLKDTFIAMVVDGPFPDA